MSQGRCKRALPVKAQRLIHWRRTCGRVGLVFGLLALAACDRFNLNLSPGALLPTATARVPDQALQHYNCMAGDAMGGALTMRGDGTANFNGQEGSWSFDGATQQFVFSSRLSLETGSYDAATGQLRVKVRPGDPMPQAEDGTLTCKPKE